jgi:hypothetical protein
MCHRSQQFIPILLLALRLSLVWLRVSLVAVRRLARWQYQCAGNCAPTHFKHMAARAAHEIPARVASLPPPPARWAPGAVGEQGAAEDDAALWEWTAPANAGEAARAFVHHCRDTALDVYAAFLAFASQLVTVETFGVAAVAVAAVLAFARGFETGGNSARHHRLAANLNWAVFASAVVFPLCVVCPRLQHCQHLITEASSGASQDLRAERIVAAARDGAAAARDAQGEPASALLGARGRTG